MARAEHTFVLENLENGPHIGTPEFRQPKRTFNRGSTVSHPRYAYRRFPSEGTLLQLKRDENSNFENAVMVETLDTWNMQMVGHLAAEHTRLVAKWIDASEYKVCIDHVELS